MVFILVSHADVPLTRCPVKRYVLVWPPNKGHAKSLSCKTDVGSDLGRALYFADMVAFRANILTLTDAKMDNL